MTEIKLVATRQLAIHMFTNYKKETNITNRLNVGFLSKYSSK